MNYSQLTGSQRYQIESYLKADYTITEIAKALGVHKSTISREIKRNSKKRVYNGFYAQSVSCERKKEAYKHSVFDAPMKRYIEKSLMDKQWSPEQIKGRCDLGGIAMVSVERIYQYIYWDQSQGGLLLRNCEQLVGGVKSDCTENIKGDKYLTG